MPSSIELTIVQGDICQFPVDLVGLKYAQGFYGADLAVSQALVKAGLPEDSLRPATGEIRLVDTRQGIAAPRALFVGIRPLHQVNYQDIRELAATTLRSITRDGVGVRHLAMTIHGPGFGLDEVEGTLAQVGGIMQWLEAPEGGGSLERISLVEIRADRVERLRQAFDRALAQTDTSTDLPQGWGYRLACIPAAPAAAAPRRRSQEIDSAGQGSGIKPAVFVAMPFAKEMDDVFYYGIQGAAHASGYLCERVDQEVFTGDILARVKQCIDTADLVIAELTGANPNVYLEVGYAWGKAKATVLVARSDKELKFDLQGQRCLTYERIRDLEEALSRTLVQLKAKGTTGAT